MWYANFLSLTALFSTHCARNFALNFGKRVYLACETWRDGSAQELVDLDRAQLSRVYNIQQNLRVRGGAGEGDSVETSRYL